MSELWASYWPVVLVAVVIGLIVGLWAFRPRQRVTLTKDSAPLRPHMGQPSLDADRPMPASPIVSPRQQPVARDRDGGGEGNGIGDEAAAATSDVVGEILGAPVHSNLPGSQGVPDDLQRMKGVGPKFASLLASRGITRFDQLAALRSEDIASLDEAMGPFRGRIARDRVIEQAGYLASGDEAGYEAQFGKL